MKLKNESAVSPVVGVMLMLVVTIIIAAIVSAFAGGLVGGTQKAPQAAIQGTYSQSKGMTITHSGGDAIPLTTTTIYVRPTNSFGIDAGKYSWAVNKSAVFTGNQGQTWATTRAILPGDTATISAANLSWVQMRPDGTTEASNDVGIVPNYNFDDSNNTGLSFVLEFKDSSGQSIGQGTVTITG
jgi:FlaG/FlaF family flagellin (archaellin)